MEPTPLWRRASRRTRGLAAVLATAALALGLTAAPGNATTTAPGTVAGARCSTQYAGYVPQGTYTGTNAWVRTTAVDLTLCVVRSTTGRYWAQLRVGTPVTAAKYDRFTGMWRIKLQACSATGPVDLSTATDVWDGGTGTGHHPLYDYAYIVGGTSYFFSMVYTPAVTVTWSSIRVSATAVAASVVPRNISSVPYAFSPAGVDGSNTFVSACGAKP